MAQPKVLMVAEKPSIAKAIADVLSHGKASLRRSNASNVVHELHAPFLSFPSAFIKVTSVIGHVYSCDFTAEYQSWDKVDPSTLFDAPTIKVEANPKSGITKHLKWESTDVDYLVLWLDCDREGENIAFEVIENTSPFMKRLHNQQQIYRAKFSAISASDIQKAMNSLISPNINEARAVDARQEIDLKVGVAFTRFQTRFFQGKYGNLDSSLVSYGPCQTPTLGFCVDRHDDIQTFSPEPFWTLAPVIEHEGRKARLEWRRGRVFDREVALLFERMVMGVKEARVISTETKMRARPRPIPLNTVDLLKVASQRLGIGPKSAMIIAERLYIQGYISYPRTESTKYPESFDIVGTLRAQSRSEYWGEYVRSLLESGIERPKQGHDAGDHPPITPIMSASPEMLRGDDWRVYDYIVRHFLASVSSDCKYEKQVIHVDIAGEQFRATGTKTVSPGFTAILHGSTPKDEGLPTLHANTSYPVVDTSLVEGKTSPPDYLTESELIGLMEKNGIGTDASIATHISNICERNYVTVDSGRRLIPTHLGIALVHGYYKIDPDIVLPTIRSTIERWIDLIANGKADFDTVVKHSLKVFSDKFHYFVSKINAMDQLFEASFTTIDKTAGSKLKTKCGKCRRYMQYIPLKPTRLHCPTCEETYNLPQNGSIKLYQERQCPLDNFELVLFSFGSGQKSFPLCPYCYNYPTLEGMKVGMGCNQCPHPTCTNSVAHYGICECPECGEGVLVLDPTSGPKWKADCNLCRFIIHLPNAHKIAPTNDVCETCGTSMLEVNFNKKDSPLPNGDTVFTGCLKCDELLHSKIEGAFSKTMHPMYRRGGGRGRRGGRRGGRGRRGGGRGHNRG